MRSRKTIRNKDNGGDPTKKSTIGYQKVQQEGHRAPMKFDLREGMRLEMGGCLYGVVAISVGCHGDIHTNEDAWPIEKGDVLLRKVKED